MSLACTHLDQDQPAAIGQSIQTLARPSQGAVRLQLFSDLHADVRAIRPPILADRVDVVIVAGDTCEGPAKGFELLRELIPAQTPIVCVAGNHEHYCGFYQQTLAEARSTSGAFGITFLENEVAIVAGVRILGCTLWTDYCLDGEARRAIAMAAARGGMNDHRRIGWQKEPWLRFRPQEALKVHVASRAFLEETLAEPFDGPSIVVTHHAPHPKSIDERYALDPLNVAFASDLSEVILEGRPQLWLHGHTHTSSDYRIGATRIVANPHGYGRENPAFDPSLVLEVLR